jgi:hypothetical protein
MKGRKHKNASEYRKPAKVRGGISTKPIFIITNEVDHKKVTNRAWRIVKMCGVLFFINIKTN